MSRGTYIIRRVLLLIPTLLAIYTLTFLLIHATPGGPWSQGDKPVPPLVMERLNAAYGLDQPLWKQYLTYLGNALQGDFGPSFSSRSRTVTDIIGDTLPVSLQLGLVAMVIAAVVGISLGTIGAIRHNSAVDYVASFIAIFGISTPSYVVVSLLVLLLSSWLGLVPTGGWSGIFSTKIIIPATALALYPAAVLARYTRASMLDVLTTDYVRTARAKGLGERLVIVRHAVRNALLPVVTLVALTLGVVIGGVFTVEYVFSYPGIGLAVVEAIDQRDFPLLQGAFLLLTISVILFNLLADLVYFKLDPRVTT